MDAPKNMQKKITTLNERLYQIDPENEDLLIQELDVTKLTDELSKLSAKLDQIFDEENISAEELARQMEEEIKTLKAKIQKMIEEKIKEILTKLAAKIAEQVQKTVSPSLPTDAIEKALAMIAKVQKKAEDLQDTVEDAILVPTAAVLIKKNSIMAKKIIDNRKRKAAEERRREELYGEK
jgi:5'-3' exonuclease